MCSFSTEETEMLHFLTHNNTLSTVCAIIKTRMFLFIQHKLSALIIIIHIFTPNTRYSDAPQKHYTLFNLICQVLSIESFISCLPVFTMSTVTQVDKKLSSITGWWVVIFCCGIQQRNTGWVESSDSPPDYSLCWDWREAGTLWSLHSASKTIIWDGQYHN